MVKIFDCIIIDDFKKKSNCIYFWTHWHSDHYKGLSNNWNNGPIYTSYETGKMLEIMFPNLKNIHYLKRDETNIITFKKEIFEINITDANHIIGSIMIIINSKYGRVLHTGDFRYNDKFENNYLIRNKTFKTVYFDNTYLNPLYKFPTQESCLDETIKIVNNNLNKKIYLLTYTIGKEEIALHLAKYFSTRIFVSKIRYDKLKLANYYIDYFTHKKDENTFISLVHKNYSKYNKVEDNSISIYFSGWNKTLTSKQLKNNYYIIPYSSHSSYNEIYTFFNLINCKNIYPIVYTKNNKELEKLKNIFLKKNSILNYFKSD